jgi:hypothetical protein
MRHLTEHPYALHANTTEKGIRMDKIFNLAVIVAGLRKDSINRKVANALIELAPVELRGLSDQDGAARLCRFQRM